MEERNEQTLRAADRGDLDAIRDLVAQGANPNCRDRHGNTPLSNAAWAGQVATLDVLVELGADLKQPGHADYELLCHAAFNAQVDSVKWLLARGADPNRALGATGEVALHVTISKKDDPRRTTIVRLLVEAGANVNVKTIPGRETSCFMRDAFLKGESPLHRAAVYGDKEMVQILLDAGADPSIKDANGDTPISWGSWHLRPFDILGLLLYGNVPGWHGCPNPNLNGRDLL